MLWSFTMFNLGLDNCVHASSLMATQARNAAGIATLLIQEISPSINGKQNKTKTQKTKPTFLSTGRIPFCFTNK